MVSSEKHIKFSVKNIVGYNLIDKLNQPIILLNLSGQIVHYNQAANRLTKNNKNIQVIDNRLILPEGDQPSFADHLYEIEEMFRYKPEQLNSCKDLIFSISNSSLGIFF